jgi:SAM-dependent methyltransferase
VATKPGSSKNAVAGARPGEAVLDAGCGTGRHALALARAGYDVTGLDHAPVLLAAARAAAGPGGPRFLLGTYDALPFADASFAAVLSLGSSLGYVGEVGDRRALAEFRRVLTGGGRLVIETLHREQLGRVLGDLEERRLPDGTRLRLRRRFDAALGVLHEEQELDAGEAFAGPRSYEMRVYRPSELCLLLRDAGFVSASFHGSLLTGAPPSPDRALVAVAQARGAAAPACREPWRRADAAARLGG